MRSNEIFKRFLLNATLVVGWVVVAGCEPPFDPMIDIVDAKARTVKVDDYSRALALVRSNKGYAIDEFENSTASNLNRWAEKQKEAVGGVGLEWKLDEDVQALLEPFKSYPSVAKISELTFEGVDAHYLRQADWCEALVKRVTASKIPMVFELFRLAAGDQPPSDNPQQDLLAVIQALNPAVPQEQLPRLADTYRLFDWVVRNTQLEPEVVPSAEEIATNSLAMTPSGIAWADGVRGLGYCRTPLQLLTYGRGDFVERAKLFMKLLEHHDIASVMLQVGGKPWVVGVELGGQLYLFDTKLGLPLPHEKIGSVATLNDVRSNPKLLEQLNLSLEESIEGDNKYWVQPDQLADLTGLLYVSPESISFRMFVLERKMVGDKLLLVSDLGKVRSRLGTIENLPLKIWDIEFQNMAYRWTLKDALIRSRSDDSLQSKLFWYYDNEAYVDTFESYRTARNMFVHGLFELDRDTDDFNVIENFYLLMYDDKKIDELATNTPLLLRLGILQTKNQNAKQYQERLQSVQAQMRLVRRDAGLFLAQSHFDNGNLGTAGNWLERIAAKEDSARWSSGILYLLGRSFESRREYDRAVAEYAKSTGPDRHGNLLRRRQLRLELERLAKSEATPAEKSGE